MSLRELIEWVIRKDTELTGLGPVCGDVAALQKQEVSILQLLLFHITKPSLVLKLSSRNLGLLWTISYEFRRVCSNLKNWLTLQLLGRIVYQNIHTDDCYQELLQFL